MPALFELDARFRAMDRAGDGYVQIVNTANPPVENVAGPAEALELSRIANDEMAELVARFPDRFAGAAACDPRFMPLFDRIAALDVPVLLHPVRGGDRADYPSEAASRFDSWRIFGWLYDTVSAMSRLVFAGLFAVPFWLLFSTRRRYRACQAALESASSGR